MAVALSNARARYRAAPRQAELDLLLARRRTAVEPAATGGAIEDRCQLLALQLGVRRACVFLAEDGVLVAAHAYHADGSVDLDGFRAFTAASSPPPLLWLALSVRTTLVVYCSAPALTGGCCVQRLGVGSGPRIPVATGQVPLAALTLD